jgi:hypothetical protein
MIKRTGTLKPMYFIFLNRRILFAHLYCFRINHASPDKLFPLIMPFTGISARNMFKTSKNLMRLLFSLVLSLSAGFSDYSTIINSFSELYFFRNPQRQGTRRFRRLSATSYQAGFNHTVMLFCRSSFRFGCFLKA